MLLSFEHQSSHINRANDEVVMIDKLINKTNVKQKNLRMAFSNILIIDDAKKEADTKNVEMQKIDDENLVNDMSIDDVNITIPSSDND